MKARKLSYSLQLLTIVVICLFTWGCSGGSGSTGNLPSGNGNIGVGGGITSGNIGGGTPLPTSSKIVVNHILARALPSGITTIRYSGLDGSERVVYGPIVRIRESQTVLEAVPLTVSTLLVEYLSGANVVGTYRWQVNLIAGTTQTLNDPGWSVTECVPTKPWPGLFTLDLFPLQSEADRPYLADLDDDGKFEMITASYLGDITVTGLDSKGKYFDSSQTNHGLNTHHSTLTDINKDKRPDLILSNYSNQSITVLKGDGSRSFTTVSQQIAVETRPGAISVGDFNKDTWPDVVFARKHDNTNAGYDDLYIAFNDGNGNLLPPVYVAGGFTLNSIACADFNSDHALDLVVADGAYYRIFWNLGDGTFSASNSTRLAPNGGLAERVVALDSDSDGDPDVCGVSINNGQAVFESFRNDGKKSFTLTGTAPSKINTGELNFGDMDRDGDPDIVEVDLPGQITIRLNDGAGRFLTTQTLHGPLGGSCALADVDGDGDLDIGLSNGIVFNLGDGRYLSPTATVLGPDPISTGGSSLPGYSVSGDFDKDGDIDVAVCDTGKGLIKILLNDSFGHFSLDASYSTQNQPTGLKAMDLDGDKDLDLLTVCYGSNILETRINNGHGDFSATTDTPLSSGPMLLTAGDLFGDNDPDLVIYYRESKRIEIMENFGKGTFAVTTPPLTVEGYLTSGIVADLDHDKDNDLFLIDSSFNRAVLYLNNGDGTFGQPEYLALPNNFSAYGLLALDFDGDQDLDILTTSGLTDSLALFRQNAQGKLDPVVTIPVGRHSYALAAADLNGDNLADLIVQGTQGETLVKLNQGDGTYSASPLFYTGSSYAPPLTFDADGDGDFDVVRTDNSTNELKTLYNQACSILPFP